MKTTARAAAITSLTLLSAHFYRAGNFPLLIATVALPALLLTERRWAGRVLRIALALGAAEWVHTAFQIAFRRIERDMPWHRMAAILGAVALFTAASAALLPTGERDRRTPSR